jgi:hypothetical protein
LADQLTHAMRLPGFLPLHARGRVLTDLACAIVLGAVAIGDIAVLEHQRTVLGGVASPATVWRVLDEMGELQQRRIATARASVRRRVWDLLAARPEGFPWITVDGRALEGWTVLDSDATPVATASEKEGSAGTYKKGVFGLCPILAFCDNTGEMLAQQLRPGDAGANDTQDNIAIFEAAVAQLPGPYRREILFRTDGAGFSCGLLAWIAAAGGRVHPSFTWEYSTGWTFTDREMKAVLPWTIWRRRVAGRCGRPRWTPTGTRARTPRSPRSPACSATWVRGRPGTGSSCAANPCTPGTPRTPPRTRPSTRCGCRPSPPTPPVGNRLGSIAATVPTPGSSPRSAMARTAGSTASPPAS